jgi:hypothetical protein
MTAQADGRKEFTMNNNIKRIGMPMAVLLLLGGMALLGLVLQAQEWAPALLASVSWNGIIG